MQAYTHILVPVDFTRITNLIVKRADELARFYGVKLTMLNVLTDVPVGSMTFGADGRLPVPQDVKQRQVESAREKMRQLADSLGVAASMDLQVAYTSGKASEAIIQYVKDNGVDLVVVGNSGKKSVLGFMGSTAEAVLKGVPCDVMALRLRD